MKGYVLKRHPKGTYPNMKAECAKPFGFAHFVTHNNSLESSIKFLQASVRAHQVRCFYLWVSPIRSGSTLPLYTCPAHPPLRQLPSGELMGLRAGTAFGFWSIHLLSVWSWANYSESQLPCVTLGLGNTSFGAVQRNEWGQCACRVVRAG